MLAYAFINWVDPFNDRRFSASDWAVAESEERARMASDLTDRVLARGMSVDAIQNLLGPPDSTLTGDVDAGGNKLHAHQTLSYYLGSWSGYGYDDAFLYLHLNQNGAIENSQVTGY